MPFLRKPVPEDPLSVAMAGVRLGLRVLIVAADDAEMASDIAVKVGLSGQVVAIGLTAQGVSRVSNRAERRGVLVEVSLLQQPFPFPDHAFDLAVADDRSQPSGARTERTLLEEVFRVLRPGGRLVVLRPAARSRSFIRAANPNASDETRALAERLAEIGFRAAREIGTRERTIFIEAARAG
jgi:ubiquinone/menaquinone biosynthesis C-methylase UbiE